MDQVDAVGTSVIGPADPVRPRKATNINRDASTTSADPASKASKRPKNTALKQQRLPAWQPILTAKTVIPLFFAVGVVFVILGGVLLHYSNLVSEYAYDYTECTNAAGVKCSTLANYNTSCTCAITILLENDFSAPVYLYYGLKNFYQNHRRYVKSRDDKQLLGDPVTTLSSECYPYSNSSSKNIGPCGAIANSLFNDTFSISYYGSSTASPAVAVGLLETDIAWTTDRNVKFQNPSSWSDIARPLNWQKDVWNLSSVKDNNGYQNEDLIVWMRTAALPTFRKLHRRVDHSQPSFTGSLSKGYYAVTINYNYPVVSFSGQKSFIISTTTWIGGKNPFLGIAYLVVGSLCILLGIVFLIIHLKFSQKIPTNVTQGVAIEKTQTAQDLNQMAIFKLNAADLDSVYTASINPLRS